MDKKKRTILMVCVAILIGSYTARSFVISYLRMAYAQQQAMRQRQQPKPKPSPNESTADAARAAEIAAIGNLSGVWEGRGQVPARGICNLRLELKQIDSGHYSGYSRFSCVSTALFTNPKDLSMMTNMLKDMNPDAAIFTGSVEKGAIHLNADKTIGTDINGCAVTELTITPFGASAIAAEWLEGTCQGGNLMMQRAVR